MATTAHSSIPDRLLQIAWGFAPVLIIQSALQNRLFDVLERRPLALPAIAKAAGVSGRGAKAVLNALVGLQLLKKQGERYSLTPESRTFLVASSRQYYGAYFRHMAAQLMPQWLNLPEITKTGLPTLETNQETSGSEHFAKFVDALFNLSFGVATKVGEHLGVRKCKAPLTVLDIGAGSGVWGIALAQLSVKVAIRAVDFPKVLKITRQFAERWKVTERMVTVPGDFIEADFGKGHQVAALGHILHSEGPARIKTLLKKVYNSLAPGGTIVIQEFVPSNDRMGPPPALIFAVNMLVNTRAGDTYTFKEISQWLKAAGFIKMRQFDAGSVSPVILATKP